MNSLHPHWHATDEGEQPVPVRSAKKPKNIYLNGAVPISRKPAALLGMLLVTAIGVTLFNTTDVTGQLTGNTVTVHITENGFNPASVTVKRGDTIQWINDHIIPQIIFSDTLCNDIEECLYTAQAFQGDQVEFVVTPDIPAGTYQYRSIISQDLSGVIIVEGAEDTTPPPSDPPEDSPPPPPSEDMTEDPPQPAPQPPPPVVSLTPPSQNIPSNPNTSGGNSVSPPTNPNHAGAPPPVTGHKPFAQPQTGAGTWIIALIFLTSAAVLAWGTKRAFR